VAVGIGSVVVGLTVARGIGLAPGATIVLVAAAIFLVVAGLRRALPGGILPGGLAR
jgi:ABC-type Mn2+/Zn2+ transport system permease subunit